MKRVRMLLRVSSNQQLEADGDLSVQRQLVKEYVQKQKDWVLDDILVAYKDDRIGRRMWEIGAYVMSLKSHGVDIYTVKDGCISPESDDIMGQMVLALRYGNAQKSSSDTGMRVKDTAKKLVQKGKFMGGKAPYGYYMELSGEISKHGRALQHLVVDPEQSVVVKYIYELALNKEFGSSKIAKLLNEDEKYRKMAPNGVWKSGTITSILTNPIYAGYTAYNRREKLGGKYHRLGSKDWITAREANEELAIVDEDVWNRIQEKRKLRGDKYIRSATNTDVKVIGNNCGMLALIDVLYCGYCGAKMTNGSRYNYWTVKKTGEKRCSKTYAYKCQAAWQGVPQIEPIVFAAIAEYVGTLQENEDVFEEIEENQQKERKILRNDLDGAQQELNKIQKKIAVMEENIPNAMTGEYPLTLEELMRLINKQKDMETRQLEVVRQKRANLENANVSIGEWDELRKQIPTWQDVFLNADVTTKRVLVNKLVERIDVTEDSINVRFRINLNDIFTQSRITGDCGTILCIRGLR